MSTKINGYYIFSQTKEAFNKGAQVLIHKGGTGSGKTYQIMMYLIFVAAQERKCIITVVSESKPHLDIGAIRIAKELIASAGMTLDVVYNETKSFFVFPNRTILEFFSADRIDKALGARRDWLYGNEINSLKLAVWDELARRSTNVVGDFNPTAEFWLEEWMRFYPNSAVVRSSYLNNPALPETERARIALRAELDLNFYRIHVLCEYGTTEGLVYPSFQVIDEFPITIPEVVVYGLDWGYVNDPTVLLMVGVKDNNVYVDELIYQTGLSNRAIMDKMQQMGFTAREIIYADVEPKSIDELKQAGYSIWQVKKGRVEDEVREIRDNDKIFISRRSVNTLKEIRNYRFAIDRAGKSLNVPVKGDDHAMDAMRYARLSVKKKNKMKWA